MLKHILVPVDGTDYSWRALDYAADLAALSGGELFIVTIVREGGNPIGSAPLRSEEEVEEDSSEETAVMQIGNEVLDVAGTVMMAHPNIHCRYLMINGDHISSLVLEAQFDWECDTIVIGSRGLSRFKSFWQDSVSSNVVRLAQVPVIVVK